MDTKKILKNIWSYLLAFLQWLSVGILVGALCGVTGAGFSKSVSFVTSLRGAHPWLLYLLPVFGVISVALYKLCRVEGVGTNQVFESVRAENKVTFKLAPAIFLSAVLTHLGGGSAGKEGAALQLGGSISSVICKLFRLNDKTRHILTMCGMGALFSAVFGTPLGACVFALEVVSIGNFCSAAFFPALVSSVTAFIISSSLGIASEHFDISNMPSLNVGTVLRVAAVAVICAVVSILFCMSLHAGEKLFKKYLKNSYLRIAIGGALIVILTVIIGDFTYNGGGMETIEKIFAGENTPPYAFLIKIIFTVITVGAGLKGGEIVPTFFVGATLGGVLASVVGISSPFGAAIGMCAMFCSVTNCPLATIILAIELFGSDGAIFYAVAVAISFLLSGKYSLYSSQHFIYSKLNEILEER